MSKRWYAIGPVQTVDDPVEGRYQCAPDGCVGWIDTRPIGDIAAGFFAFDTRPDHLKETHDLIGDGTRLDEYHPTLAERAAWASAYAVSVNSTDTLLDMLVALLTDQADPDGLERCRPLTVDHRGNYEIHLGGHSRIYRAKFRGEKDRLWPNLQRLWQQELRKTHATEAKRGVDPDVQAGKMLAELSRLHRCPVAELTPKELKGLKPRKPTTTHRDDFNRANGELSAAGNATWGGVDQGWGWTKVHGALSASIGSQELVVLGGHYISNAVLSGTNHWAQYELSTNTRNSGIVLRYSSNMNTYVAEANTDAQAFIVRKWVARSPVLLSYMPDTLLPPPFLYRAQIDGSTISSFADGDNVHNVTDTTFSNGVQVGFGGLQITSVLDDFVAADLLTAGIPLLLRNTRAV